MRHYACGLFGIVPNNDSPCQRGEAVNDVVTDRVLVEAAQGADNRVGHAVAAAVAAVAAADFAFGVGGVDQPLQVGDGGFIDAFIGPMLDELAPVRAVGVAGTGGFHRLEHLHRVLGESRCR